MAVPETPYGEDGGKSLTLRDQLAVDRTALANERTLLAYARTGLALLIVGGSLLKFFDSCTASLTGCLFVVAGPVIGALGAVRFVNMRRRLHALNPSAAQAPDDPGSP